MREKFYTSQDGSIRLSEKDITHVCVAPCLYALLQYLLLLDEEITRRHTFYFFTDDIPQSTIEQLPCCYIHRYPNASITQLVYKRLRKFFIALFGRLQYPFLKTAEIYAQDIPDLCIYIGNRPYNLLADAQECFSLNMQEDSLMYQRMKRKQKSVLGHLQRWIYGDLYVGYFGNNKWCKTINLTEENTSSVLAGRDVRIHSLETMWEKASRSKRNFVMSLFGVTENDAKKLNEKPIVFFSQPMIEDCKLSEEEYRDLLERIFELYDSNLILIKTHPRDKFDYARFFPHIALFNKSVNSQFLQLMGLHPKRVITISSSAIENFPESVECDYFGAAVHPKILDFFGTSYKPQRKVNNIKF